MGRDSLHPNAATDLEENATNENGQQQGATEVIVKPDSPIEPEEGIADFEKPSTFDRLLEHCYKMPDSTPFIFGKSGNGSEVVCLDEKSAIDYYMHQYYCDEGSFPKKKDAKEDVTQLRLLALYNKPVLPVAHRVQKYSDDSGDGIELKISKKISVKVTAKGIECGPHSGCFWSPDHEQDLPMPNEVGSIEPFLAALGITDADQRILLTGLLLMYLYPTGPYPMVVFKGPNGSGKSTISTGFKSLLDPSLIEKIADVKSPRDLYVVAALNRILNFDNVSEISGPLYDAHCTIATGGQRAERKLYTNKEMSCIRTENPQVFNGIPALFHREDFRERAVLIELPVLERRRSLGECNRELEATKPAALGYLLRAMQVALANLETTETPQGIRMADAAKLVAAAEPFFGWEPGTFENAYKRNQLKSIRESLSEQPVYQVLKRVLEHNNGQVSGKPEAVLQILNTMADTISPLLRDEKTWPKSPSALSLVLNRLEGTLAVVGIRIRQERVDACTRRTTIIDEQVQQANGN